MDYFAPLTQLNYGHIVGDIGQELRNIKLLVYCKYGLAYVVFLKYRQSFCISYSRRLFKCHLVESIINKSLVTLLFEFYTSGLV